MSCTSSLSWPVEITNGSVKLMRIANSYCVHFVTVKVNRIFSILTLLFNSNFKSTMSLDTSISESGMTDRALLPLAKSGFLSGAKGGTIIKSLKEMERMPSRVTLFGTITGRGSFYCSLNLKFFTNASAERRTFSIS